MSSGWARFLIAALFGFGLGSFVALAQGGGIHLPQSIKDVYSSAKISFFEKINTDSNVQNAAVVSTSKSTSVAGVEIGDRFLLVNHNGDVVTEKSWPGKYKLVFFGFTYCPAICPAGLKKMSLFMEEYDPKGEKVVPLFITVDSKRDTAAVIKKYLSDYNPYIVGLTGTEGSLKTVQKSYRVYASKVEMEGEENYMMDHSAYMYLMSPEGEFLEIFGNDITVEEMIAKMRLHSL